MRSDIGIMGYLEAAARQESKRQAAIANNIANMNTPGYRRVDIKFNDILAEKISEGREISTEESEPQLIEPRNSPINEMGNDVSLDSEVGDMVKNSLMHKTYIRLLELKYRQIDMATNFNK
jgi:flagellar basal-body rod protein FlgB